MLDNAIGHNDEPSGAISPVATRFKKGERYSIGSGLLTTFIELGVVELVDGQSTVENLETKIVAPSETKPAKPSKKKA